jgi:alkylation response protein AidB-like acyl-CoA dehydrogenase
MAVPRSKYDPDHIKQRFLPPLLPEHDHAWQGATWMAEIRGDSDLGANVAPVTTRSEDAWRLTGNKYFASNARAELAAVAARQHGPPKHVSDLALFLVPRHRENGECNHFIRQLKGQDRHALGSHRYARVALQRGAPAGRGRRGNLPHLRGAQCISRRKRASQHNTGAARHPWCAQLCLVEARVQAAHP